MFIISTAYFIVFTGCQSDDDCFIKLRALVVNDRNEDFIGLVSLGMISGFRIE